MYNIGCAIQLKTRIHTTVEHSYLIASIKAVKSLLQTHPKKYESVTVWCVCVRIVIVIELEYTIILITFVLHAKWIFVQSQKKISLLPTFLMNDLRLSFQDENWQWNMSNVT